MDEEKIKQEKSKMIENKLYSLKQLKRLAVILCYGGYFSIGIFESDKCVFHTSDHKYVTRKKAGQR